MRMFCYLVISILLLCEQPAHARGWRHHGHHFYAPPVYLIERSTGIHGVPGGGVMSDDEYAAKMRRIHKWEEFCQPVIAPDALGVMRYSYAHDGCDLGRSE